jgi:hypothetical protein
VQDLKPLAAKRASPRAAGGCIYGAARSAVTSGVVTVRRASTPKGTRFLPDIPLWLASNRFRIGFSTIEQEEFSEGRDSRLLDGVRKVSQRRAPKAKCLRIGKPCCTTSCEGAKLLRLALRFCRQLCSLPCTGGLQQFLPNEKLFRFARSKFLPRFVLPNRRAESS